MIPNLYNLEKDYLYIFVDILFIEIASNIPKVIATLVIYKCRFKILSLFNKRIKSILSINPSTYLRGFKVPFIIFFLLSFIFFILQTEISGFGFVNALFNPRINYLEYRSGVGIYWLASQIFFSFSLVMALIGNINKLKYLLIVILFIPMSYVFGSKGFIVGLLIMSMTIYVTKFRVRFFPDFIFFIIVAFVLFIAISASGFVLNLDDMSTLSEKVINYFEYYKNSIYFMSGLYNGEYGYLDGKMISTAFWDYIPRSFFSDKPYIYGGLYVTELQYGADTIISGHTPGYSKVIFDYADFGMVSAVLYPLFSPYIYFQILASLLASYSIKERLIHSGVFLVPFVFVIMPDFSTYLNMVYIIVLLLLFRYIVRFILR